MKVRRIKRRAYARHGRRLHLRRIMDRIVGARVDEMVRQFDKAIVAAYVRSLQPVIDACNRLAAAMAAEPPLFSIMEDRHQ